jgi:hypothetical protein
LNMGIMDFWNAFNPYIMIVGFGASVASIFGYLDKRFDSTDKKIEGLKDDLKEDIKDLKAEFKADIKAGIDGIKEILSVKFDAQDKINEANIKGHLLAHKKEIAAHGKTLQAYGKEIGALKKKIK